MKLIVCVDKKNGMMFAQRRQSKDSVVCQKVLELVGQETMWVSGYSAALFQGAPNIVVDNDYLQKAGQNDYCFIEDGGYDISDCTQIILYKWNRLYPADKYFEFDPKALGFKRVAAKDFVGTSHPKITEEIYQRG